MIKNYLKTCIMAGFELYNAITKRRYKAKYGSVPDDVMYDLKEKRIRIVDFIRK